MAEARERGSGGRSASGASGTAPAARSAALHAAAVVGSLLAGLEILGLGGMPGPRRIAAMLAGWAILLLVLPAVFGGRRSASAPAGPRRSRRREKLGLALAGACGAFLAVETATLSFFPDLPLEIAPDPGSPTPLVQKDPQLRGRFTPGFHGRFLRWSYRGVAVRINERGFRDRRWESPPRRLPGQTRLFAVGDSFTFGTGVAEEATYLRELERRMGGERSFRTFNAGVPGFGPIDESFVLRRHFGDIAPDVVLVAVYTGNDLDDVVLAANRLAGSAPTRERTSARRSAVGWQHAPAILVEMSRAAYWKRACRICALAEPSVSALAARLGWTLAPADAGDSFLLRSCSWAPDPEVERVTRILLDVLDDAADYCRLRRARLVVMLMPLRQFVEPGAFEEALAGIPKGKAEGFSRDVLHERLRHGLEERGLPVLDLLPVLRARAEDGASLFFPDGHLTEEGNREVARVLAAFLRARLRSADARARATSSPP